MYFRRPLFKYIYKTSICFRERIKASNEEKAKIRLEKAQAAHEKKLKDKEVNDEKLKNYIYMC